MDLDRNESVRGIERKGCSMWRLYKMLTRSTDFRSIYYMRIGSISRIIRFLLPGVPMCHIGNTKTAFVGGGVYIQHGWSMVLDAE